MKEAIRVTFHKDGKSERIKLNVSLHSKELFSEILEPLFSEEKELNHQIITIEIEGHSIKANPTRSWDFTVIDLDDFEPHINRRGGSRKYYDVESFTFKKGTFQMKLGIKKTKPTPLKENIIKGKNRYIEQFKQRPSVVRLTPTQEIQIESMTKSELGGNLLGEVSVKGARVLNEFLGLKIEWKDHGRIELEGPSGKLDELDWRD